MILVPYAALYVTSLVLFKVVPHPNDWKPSLLSSNLFAGIITILTLDLLLPVLSQMPIGPRLAVVGAGYAVGAILLGSLLDAADRWMRN